MSRLRRMAWGTWPPPIEKPSPSPPAARTRRSGIGHLDALGDRQRAAVDRVETVGRRVAGNPARAADAGDEGDLVGRAADGGERPVDRGDYAVVAAAGAPDGLQVALEVPGRVDSRVRGGQSQGVVIGMAVQARLMARSCSRSSSGADGVGAALGERGELERNVHPHADQAVQLALVRLLDHEAPAQRAEEVRDRPPRQPDRGASGRGA